MTLDRRYRLVGDVQPCRTPAGASFRFRVTDGAEQLFRDAEKLNALLEKVAPSLPKYDVFISYAAGDSALAAELRAELASNDLKCFMAEKDVQVSDDWQDSVREALKGSERVLILITPRSINRSWVLIETGAAWALGKVLIPALLHVEIRDLQDPIRRYQARVIETTGQREQLVNEMRRTQDHRR